MLSVEEITLVQDRKECLFEHLSIGIEGNSLASAGRSGNFGQGMFGGAIGKRVDFLVSRNSNVPKAMRDMNLEARFAEKLVALDCYGARKLGALEHPDS